MSEVSTQAGILPEVAPGELQAGKRRALLPLLVLSRLAMHPQTHFEAGAEDAIESHRDAGGSLLILMTHFTRVEPFVLAQMATKQKALRHIPYTTGITARREIGELPWPAGYIVRNSGAQFVDRSLENQNETAAEKALRQERNQQKQAIGGRFLANGLNWLIFPEGGSKKTVIKDGEKVREKRDRGVLLPLQPGFAYTLESMSTQERQRAKLLGIAVDFLEEGFMSVLRPTVYVTRPEAPVSGDREALMQQGTELLARGVEESVRLASLRH
jgi:1-acyl-sn-glycerol-3-phosphate acyltransferase